MATLRQSSIVRRLLPVVAAVCVLGVAALLIFATRSTWAPLLTSSGGQTAGANDGHDDHDHHDHDHDHGHSEAALTSIELSEQAQRNIGLNLAELKRQTFERSITVPAIVTEHPVCIKLRVTAPLTGVVTDLFVVEGQAVLPGDLLFILRLTHEDLVNTQIDYLKTLEERDVERREIARLEQLMEGAVAGKVLLERQYELQRLDALRRAQRQALLLHGLSEQQIEVIEKERSLLRELRVTAPALHDASRRGHLLEHHAEETRSGEIQPVVTADVPVESPSQADEPAAPLVIQSLNVHHGDHVEAGRLLCELADLSELSLEGRAFEQDSAALLRAASQGWRASALLDGPNSERSVMDQLEIVHVSNMVDPQSRVQPFYARLPNEMLRDATTPEGRRFVSWRFKPGQRMQLRVPVEKWENSLVVPANALAQEGAETYIFVQNGKRFDRRPVHVVYRDRYQAVIADDGSLFPGERFAASGAHQLLTAMKNTSAPIDPHAGHSH